MVRGCRDHMVVRFTNACAISAYHHSICEFESHILRGVLDTTLCDKSLTVICDRLGVFPDTPVSSTNKTDCHHITEILLKIYPPSKMDVNENQNFWKLSKFLHFTSKLKFETVVILQPRFHIFLQIIFLILPLYTS